MNLDGVERISYFKENRRAKRKLTTTLIFLILASTLLIIYFSISSGKFFKKENKVELKIKVPQEIFIGEKFDFKISIFNQEKSNLVNSELFLNFPENFHYLSSQLPCSEIFPKGCIISLPEIRKGEEKEIEIESLIFGLPGETKNLTATLNFQLEKFSSRFKKEVTKEIVLSPSNFELEIQSPKELMRTEEGDFRIKIKNKSDKEKKARIIISFPDDFNFTFLSLKENEEEKKKFFDLDFIKGEEKEISFKGFFSEKGEEKRLSIQLAILDPQGKSFLQKEEEFIIKNTEPGLVLGIKIDDNFLDEIPKNFGEKIKISLFYKNIGQEKIFEPQIKLKISPPFPINFENLEKWCWTQGEKNFEGDRWKIEINNEEGDIIFTSERISEIGINEEGEINFFLAVKSYEGLIKFKPQNLKISLIGEIEAKIFRQGILIFKVTSNEIALKINSKVKLDCEIRYFSDEGFKIGDGPLPPKVGETTSYFVFLRPVNTVNEIKNIKIITHLSEKVNLIGEEKASVGELSFDNFSKEIIWQIDSLPSYAGGSYSFVEAGFKIALTPQEEDRGKVIVLLEKISFQADDVFTGAKVYVEKEPLTTDLEFDDLAKGKGKVE